MRFVFVSALALVALAAACNPKKDGASLVPGSVPVTVDSDGFKPSSVKFPKGQANAQLVFTRTTDQTCATKVVFPELKIEKDLPKDQAVAIAIPTDKAQTLTFQCGMGMYKSSVVVSEN